MKRSKRLKKITAFQTSTHYLRSIFLYAFLLVFLLSLLKLVEYRYVIHDFSLEVYIGFVATLFTALGIWIALKLTKKPFNSKRVNQAAIIELKISKREYEILELISKGFSNQEIANKLFISLTTVKTHSSNIFTKLSVQSRTQAIHKAKKLNIIL